MVKIGKTTAQTIPVIPGRGMSHARILSSLLASSPNLSRRRARAREEGNTYDSVPVGLELLWDVPVQFGADSAAFSGSASRFGVCVRIFSVLETKHIEQFRKALREQSLPGVSQFLSRTPIFDWRYGRSSLHVARAEVSSRRNQAGG